MKEAVLQNTTLSETSFIFETKHYARNCRVLYLSFFGQKCDCCCNLTHYLLNTCSKNFPKKVGANYKYFGDKTKTNNYGCATRYYQLRIWSEIFWLIDEDWTLR